MTQDAALRCMQRTQRNIEIDPILAFTTQHDASATEGVHKLKRNATQRLASYCEPALSLAAHVCQGLIIFKQDNNYATDSCHNYKLSWFLA